MSNGLISRLLGLRAEELSSGAARESASQLRLPTLDERVSLYSRAVREQHGSGDEAYSIVRDRILDAMAADIATKAGIKLPEELERPGLRQDPNPNETGWQPDLLEYRRRYPSARAHALLSEPFEFSERFEHATPDLLAEVACLAKTAVVAQAAARQRIAPTRRPALRLAMLSASIFAVAAIGGLVTMSLLKDSGSPTELAGVVPKSDKLELADQSSQKPSDAPPQAVARNEQIATETATSAGAPAVISMANPPSQTAVAALDRPTLANQLTSEQIAQLAAKLPTDQSAIAGLAEPSSTNQLTPEGIADLVKRGRELIVAGKIHDARLLLKRAADAGDASAALALATTYDPAELEKLQARDADPDIAMARAWYQKAKGLASTPDRGFPQNSDR